MKKKYKKEVLIMLSAITISSIILLISSIAKYPKFYLEFKTNATNIIFCAGGIAVTAVLMICVILAPNITENKLKKLGNIIYAQFDSVWKREGEKTYIIICKYIDETGKELKFKSRGLDFNPECAIKELGISTFPVYIDKQKKKKYIIDLKQLTENLVDLR